MYWVAIAYAVSTPIAIYAKVKLKPEAYNDPVERLRHKASEGRPSCAWMLNGGYFLFDMFWVIAFSPVVVAIVGAVFAVSAPVIFVADKVFGVNLLASTSDADAASKV